MPKDYGLAVTPANEQRRPEHARDDDWTRAFLVRARVGRVATRWGDQPFITPTTFWYDPQRREIYFHSNLVGRVRANGERHARVCFEASEFGRLLPSNVALEFSLQYESVFFFGLLAFGRQVLFQLSLSPPPHLPLIPIARDTQTRPSAGPRPIGTPGTAARRRWHTGRREFTSARP